MLITYDRFQVQCELRVNCWFIQQHMGLLVIFKWVVVTTTLGNLFNMQIRAAIFGNYILPISPAINVLIA